MTREDTAGIVDNIARRDASAVWDCALEPPG